VVVDDSVVQDGQGGRGIPHRRNQPVPILIIIITHSTTPHQRCFGCRRCALCTLSCAEVGVVVVGRDTSKEYDDVDNGKVFVGEEERTRVSTSSRPFPRRLFMICLGDDRFVLLHLVVFAVGSGWSLFSLSVY
jgi:hypothetical protein